MEDNGINQDLQVKQSLTNHRAYGGQRPLASLTRLLKEHLEYVNYG